MSSTCFENVMFIIRKTICSLSIVRCVFRAEITKKSYIKYLNISSQNKDKGIRVKYGSFDL